MYCNLTVSGRPLGDQVTNFSFLQIICVYSLRIWCRSIIFTETCRSFVDHTDQPGNATTLLITDLNFTNSESTPRKNGHRDHGTFSTKITGEKNHCNLIYLSIDSGPIRLYFKQ